MTEVSYSLIGVWAIQVCHWSKLLSFYPEDWCLSLNVNYTSIKKTPSTLTYSGAHELSTGNPDLLLYVRKFSLYVL